MEVSTWKSVSYGIRIPKKHRQNIKEKCTNKIQIKLDGKYHEFKIRSTFWTTCPEVRGKPIEKWLRKHKKIIWPKGKPHKLILDYEGENKFTLKIP